MGAYQSASDGRARKAVLPTIRLFDGDDPSSTEPYLLIQRDGEMRYTMAVQASGQGCRFELFEFSSEVARIVGDYAAAFLDKQSGRRLRVACNYVPHVNNGECFGAQGIDDLRKLLVMLIGLGRKINELSIVDG